MVAEGTENEGGIRTTLKLHTRKSNNMKAFRILKKNHVALLQKIHKQYRDPKYKRNLYNTLQDKSIHTQT